MPQMGLVSIPSRYSASETMERLLAALKKRDLNVFIRVDHAAGAASVGMPLRPTEVVLFGNPKGGTALMQDQQVAGIDLPLKALVWQDADGKVWLSYNAPDWIAARAGLSEKSTGAVAAMTKRSRRSPRRRPRKYRQVVFPDLVGLLHRWQADRDLLTPARQ